jgi:hypothetical protein
LGVDKSAKKAAAAADDAASAERPRCAPRGMT